MYVIFDKYFEDSIKSHERMQRTGVIQYPDIDIQLDTDLPTRDHVMKNSHNKQKLLNLMCSIHHQTHVHLFWEQNCLFHHEEADVSIIAYMNKYTIYMDNVL